MTQPALQEIDMTASAPVLVTGATGFIASRVVEQLLAGGARVRGTVRNLKKPGDIQVLQQLPGAFERLELVEADLLREGSFDAPADGCGTVVHTASPYQLNVRDAQKDLVDPAVIGTNNVLNACERAGSVTRVVLTSSMAAVTDEPASDHTLTEADWNTKSSLDRNPYYYAKTLAEKAAWDFMAQRKPLFDLVAINPFMVVGPSLTSALNTSNRIFVDLLKGTYPGILSLTWGFVDVRDVADAHVRALATPAAHGRYLCAGDTLSMRGLVDLLAANGYGGYKLPKRPLDTGSGNILVRLLSFTQSSGVGSYLRSHVGRVPRYDTSKIRRELGISFRAVEQSVLDTVQDLARWGHLPARR
jgi:dihydroflavonol-4-reductase